MLKEKRKSYSARTRSNLLSTICCKVKPENSKYGSMWILVVVPIRGIRYILTVDEILVKIIECT